LGARLGVDFLSVKGVTSGSTYYGARPWEPLVENQYYKNRTNYVGPSGDVMLSLTNWWCGYKPNRVYNAYLTLGGGVYWTLAKGYKEGSTTEFEWSNTKDMILALRAGLTQEFNITRHFSLGLDLRLTALENHTDPGYGTTLAGQALITAAYKFGNTEWHAPVVPVCPVAENCDEYRARLQAADARIADLEAQLKACLSRPVEKVEVAADNAPLATIYYPANAYRLTSVDRKVLQSVASVMNNDNNNYTLTGWADNYTGSDAYNQRLRENRVNTVKDQLVKYGVSADKLNATTNNSNRVDLGDKCLTLDRCVTIEAAK
jgi:outer membrane protein OmpA-like peptidoglycan-associated protein